MKFMPKHWLFKTDPQEYSFDDLERDQRVMWGGVRNSVTLKNLRDVRLGDQIMIYHTGDENAVIGTAEAVTDAYPDPAENDESVVVVEIRPRRKFAQPVLLAEIKASNAMSDLDPARLPLLSVMPLSNLHWESIQGLSK
jgi:predicted RNA-binding protein with PUA-like domain